MARAVQFVLAGGFCLMLAPNLRAAGFTVTSTADAGAGSLRDAITQANTAGGANTIEFNIPGAGAQTILLLSPLPFITSPVLIEGTNQVGGGEIILDGSGAGPGADGLVIEGGSSTIRKLSIGGFSGSGIVLRLNGGNVIEGAYLGTDRSTNSFGNGVAGVLVEGGEPNMVGGTLAIARNLIAFNGQAGVRVAGGTCAVLGNSMFANGVRSIDLGGTGNDPGDADVGPNGLQNHPQLVAVTNNTSAVLIEGYLDSEPNTVYRVEFFASDTANEGKTFLGSTNVTTDAGGHLSFTAAFLSGDISGKSVTATATDPFNRTSEFSPAEVSVFHGRPIIMSQPVERSVTPGASAFFTVIPAGAGPLSYQWMHDGVDIPGATNSLFLNSSVQPLDAGFYSVLVSNPAGSTRSVGALLTVLPPEPPAITAQPQGQVASPGTPVTLSFGYSGTGPMRFQWRLNGVNVPGATNAALTISSLGPTNSGSYSVIVYSTYGVVISDPAVVRLAAPQVPMWDMFADSLPPSTARTERSGLILANNVDATVEPGELPHVGKPGGRSVWLTWIATATGIASFSTAGSSFDTLLAVYEGDSLGNLVPVAANDDGGGYLTSAVKFNAVNGRTYRIVVDGFGRRSGDILLQWNLEVTSDTLPVLVVQPASQTVALGSNATFAVVATGKNLNYQWFHNGQPLAGAQASQLIIASAGLTNVGSYTVRVSTRTRSVDSDIASLQVNRTGRGAQDARAYDKCLEAAISPHGLRLENPGPGPVSLAGVVRLAGGGGLARGYSGTQIFSTYGAVTEEGEPVHCGVVGGASLWFALMSDISGRVYLNTDGSTFDTVLAVYLWAGETFADLQPVACDNNSGQDGQDSALSFQVEPGLVYLIAVDGPNGVTGAVQLNYGVAAPAILTALGTTADGGNLLQVEGLVGTTSILERSTDLVHWTPLCTTNSASGVYQFSDHQPAAGAVRIYRARTLP